MDFMSVNVILASLNDEEDDEAMDIALSRPRCIGVKCLKVVEKVVL